MVILQFVVFVRINIIFIFKFYTFLTYSAYLPNYYLIRTNIIIKIIIVFTGKVYMNSISSFFHGGVYTKKSTCGGVYTLLNNFKNLMLIVIDLKFYHYPILTR